MRSPRTASDAIHELTQCGLAPAISRIAEAHAVSFEQLVVGRAYRATKARAYACKVLRELCWSYPAIASVFGTDHGTIIALLKSHKLYRPVRAPSTPVPTEAEAAETMRAVEKALG